MSLPPNVTVIEDGSRTLYLVGTAHVSQRSVEDVEAVIGGVEPDVVCVELCAQRFEALTQDDRWKHLDIFRVIREGKILFLLASLAVSSYQRRIGKELGVQPGAELLAAAKLAEESGAELYLIDRDVQITLKRTWGNLRFFDKIQMLGAVFASLFEEQRIEASDIEKLKEEGQLEDMLTQFSSAFPRVKGPLIDERDGYMASWLREVPGERVVAVVGAAHVPGIVRELQRLGVGSSTRQEEPRTREPLEALPKGATWGTLVTWAIPVIVLAAFVWGISGEDARSPQEMLYAWILPNAIAAGLLTTIAGGKLSSIIAATIGSPITSLNPLLNTGMVVGLVDAWARKPTVEDATRIPDDVQSWQGFYTNRFTRVLVVATAAMFGSALGAWIGAFLVVRLAF